MRNHLLIGAAVAALIMPAAAYAQETTSSIRGSVSANGAPVADARILITDVNSGTKVETGTDGSGNFTASGLRAGGPYQVEITSASGNTTITDVFTVVGQPYDLPVDLTANTASTGDIVITASSIKGAGVTSDGPQTVLKSTDISKVASVNRDIRDIERRDPFASLDLSNTRAVSFGGVNPRFNRFTINGVQIGDNFGLNSDANPTGRGPIPFDAIAQVSISLAPYDIRQGNFVGGAIDTVMLSGTNEFKGTAFYSTSTDNLQGKRIGSTTITLPDYNSKTYGARLAGPIIKDRLFFMVAAERNTDPRPFTPASTAQVPGLTDGIVANVVNIAKNVYSYDAGTVLSVNNQKDEKIVGKIDLNITTGQRLSFSYVNAFESADVLNNTSTSTSTPSLGLSSDAYTRSVLVRAGIVQLNSDWSDSISTEIRGIYKANRVNQTPMNGLGFAQFRVCTDATSIVSGSNTATSCSTGVPVVAFGPDISRQANQLFFDTWAGSFLGRYTTGGHEFKALFEMSENRTFNLFQQYVTGSYYFDSLADFQNRSASSFDYANAVSLNTPDVAANFKYTQYTFGLQDDWKVSDTLNVTYGVRYDLYGQRSTPAFNQYFLARNGFDNTKTYKGLGNFQPRIGFNWKPITGLKIRGGVGIFGGGSPDIYMSNSFSNTGVLANRISTITRATGPGSTAPGTIAGSQTTLTCVAPYATGTNTQYCSPALNGVTGNTIPGSINTLLSTSLGSLATAPVNALAKDFKLPSVWKANLSVDYKFFGIEFGADYLFSRTRQGVTFTDLRSVVNTACPTCGTLPDGRVRYNFRPTPGVAGQTGDTNSDFLLYNDTRGRSHLADVRFRKDFDWGLSLAGSYTWTDVKDVSPATSSTASSLYLNAAALDSNFATYGTSNDQIKWAFKYSVGFDHAFFGDYRTVIQLFGETRAGRPYSYTMQNNVSGRSPVFGTISAGATGTDKYLLYVPTGASDTRVSYDTQATADALDALINGSALKNYRGMIAPKNIARNRAFTRIDLHLEQEIPTFVGKSRLSLFADIENLPNLINKNWGGLRQYGFPQTFGVVQVTCLQGAVPTGTAPGAANPAGGTFAAASAINQTCAQYRYSGFRLPTETAVSTSNSLYLIRVGARFSF